eukprot:6128017-Pyramimonas_sp.AAC.1
MHIPCMGLGCQLANLDAGVRVAQHAQLDARHDVPLMEEATPGIEFHGSRECSAARLEVVHLQFVISFEEDLPFAAWSIVRLIALHLSSVPSKPGGGFQYGARYRTPRALDFHRAA